MSQNNPFIQVPQPFGGSGSYNDEKPDVVIWGIPTDCGAGSHRTGASQGPRVIREASNIWNTVRTSSGFPFPQFGKVVDLGDVDLTTTPKEDVFKKVAADMPEYLPEQLMLMLGGDHSVTIPVIQKTEMSWGMIYMDAHPDVIEDYQGFSDSHACTLKRVIESGHVDPKHTVIIGMRAPESEEVDFIKQQNITVFTAWDVQEMGIKEVCRQTLEIMANQPIYLSLDMDVLDASCVPGVENPEPGGLSSREVLFACHFLAGNIRACDIVEVTDQCDPAGLTATAAARIALDIVGSYIQRKNNKI